MILILILKMKEKCLKCNKTQICSIVLSSPKPNREAEGRRGIISIHNSQLFQIIILDQEMNIVDYHKWLLDLR